MELTTKKYIRDENSGALISNDFDGLKAYKLQRKRSLELSKVTDDINSLKSELFEIKEALKTLIEIKK